MEGINQEINNPSPIEQQINVANLQGEINAGKVSRLSQKFKKLKEEVTKDVRYDGVIDDFLHYNTKLDGKSMPEKLIDGGFNSAEIKRATIRKHQYRKKLEKNKLYETAQLIDIELFAMICLNFETYIEPLINQKVDKTIIKEKVKEKIVDVIFNLLNEDGKDDIFMNYSVDDIYGIIYFLTGKCHLNWASYDNL